MIIGLGLYGNKYSELRMSYWHSHVHACLRVIVLISLHFVEKVPKPLIKISRLHYRVLQRYTIFQLVKKQWDVSFHCTFAKQNYPIESNVVVNNLQLLFLPSHVMSPQTRPHFNTIMSIDQLHAYVSLSIQASVSVSYSLVSLVSSYC